MEYTNLNDWMNAVKVLSENKSRIYIAGAGKYGAILGNYLDKHNICWEGYVDKNKELKSVNGKCVFTYQESEKEKAYYVISSYLHKEDLYQILKQNGIMEKQIVGYRDQKIFFEIYEDLAHWKKYTGKIKKYKEKYKGKRGFVIGNGPSLCLKDLEKLKNEITFGCNSVYALYKYTSWRPTFYCLTDSLACKELMSDEETAGMVMDGCDGAFTSVVGEGFRFRDNIKMNRLNFMRVLKPDGSWPDFSDDISSQIYGCGTVAYDMLQIAVYMGLKQIYLLGMDFDYSVEEHEDHTVTRKNVKNHMEEIEKEEEKRFYDAIYKRYGTFYIAHTDMQLAGYQSAKRYADTHGIKIYNATRGGKLEVFERVDFDSLF